MMKITVLVLLFLLPQKSISNILNDSISYKFGPNRGIITYTLPEENWPEKQEDRIAIGFITTSSHAVLLRIVSGTSNDYIEIYIMHGNVFVVYSMGTNEHPLGEMSAKVNDNSYHTVIFHRQGPNSTLHVDDYNVQSNHLSGHQVQLFNSQSQIQIGGKWNKKGKIEGPFTGVISGVVVNGLKILDLAAGNDIDASIKGDVELIRGILDRQDPLQEMQQTPASGFSAIENDLVFSTRSECNEDIEDICPPLIEFGSGNDDLIIAVYEPHLTPSPKPTKIVDVTNQSPVTSDYPTPTSKVSTNIEEHTNKEDTPTSYSSTPYITTTTVDNYTTLGLIYRTSYPTVPPTDIDLNSDCQQTNTRSRPPVSVYSETSEIAALVIVMIVGALIATILIILVILKFKSRGNWLFKVDDSKSYHEESSAALPSNTSNTNLQTLTQLNQRNEAALSNSDSSQMLKLKERDSKDIKDCYV